jgi:hypothetical protein
MVHSSNTNTLKPIYYAYFHSIIKCGIIFGITLPAVGISSFYRQKSSELWLVYNPELHSEVFLNN